MPKKIADEVYARQIMKYPEAWAALRTAVRTIKITCSEGKVSELAEELGQYLTNPEDYIRPVSNASHGVKFDVIVTVTAALQTVRHLFFLDTWNTYKQEQGEAQIGNRYIAMRLIADGILPRSLQERELAKAA